MLILLVVQYRENLACEIPVHRFCKVEEHLILQCSVDHDLDIGHRWDDAISTWQYVKSALAVSKKAGGGCVQSTSKKRSHAIPDSFWLCATQFMEAASFNGALPRSMESQCD